MGKGQKERMNPPKANAGSVSKAANRQNAHILTQIRKQTNKQETRQTPD